MLFVILIALSVIVVAVIGVASFYSVSGVWEKMEESVSENNLAKERISFGQLGPVIVGRRELPAGYQTFFGIAFARMIWLRRRDYGVALLVKQGFPQEIAKQLEGQVLARFRFRLSKDNLFLKGVIIPCKVEFTHQPPLVTAIHRLDAIPRTYRKIELVPVKTAVSLGACLINNITQ